MTNGAAGEEEDAEEAEDGKAFEQGAVRERGGDGGNGERRKDFVTACALAQKSRKMG
jgi:hypothetical protein